MAPARLARTPAAAAAAARGLGFPVVLKAVGPAILHKTEVGGVRLDLADAAEVAREARGLKKTLGADLTDFLVQTMVPGGVEVIAGSDPRSRPSGRSSSTGAGARSSSSWRTSRFDCLPLTDADVDAMLEEVRGTALLRGYRGATADGRRRASKICCCGSPRSPRPAPRSGRWI